MTATHSSIAIVVIVVVALAIAPATGAAVVGGVANASGDDSATEEPANSTTDASMGTELSAFMQASAADADESIDAGMFIAAYENGDNETRKTVVSQRTEHLEERLERLEADYEALTDRKDELNPVAYNAQLSRLTVQITSLERAIEDVEPRAADVGVDTTALEELRTNASELAGPEVAELARNLSSVEPHRGQPDHRDRGRPLNGSPRNAGGSPNDASTAAPNTTDRGPATGGPDVDRPEPGNESENRPDQGRNATVDADSDSNTDGSQDDRPDPTANVNEKEKKKEPANAAAGAGDGKPGMKTGDSDGADEAEPETDAAEQSEGEDTSPTDEGTTTETAARE